MGVIINHNISALNTSNNLTNTYNRLAKSVSRLSSGLRIVSASDDAAGLAVREIMRSDIRVMKQGVRNAQDAINMLMTADGAMGVIDEKLIRMKELAEQASTGTYTTAQREIMNTEFTAMSDEITRIANATEFNGIKLIDGSMSALHSGNGAKIHFGTGNSSAEDYYYVNLGDLRSSNLLGSGNGSKYTMVNSTEFGSDTTALNDSGYFGFYYNNDGDDGAATDTPEQADIYGIYEITSNMTLNDVRDMINGGNAARATVTIDTGSSVGSGDIFAVDGIEYEFVSQAADVTAGNIGVVMGAGATWEGSAAASALMTAINANGGAVWAQMSGAGTNVFTLYGKANVANDTIKVSADANFGSTTTGVGSSFELNVSGGILNGGGSSWITASVEARTNATGSTVYQLKLVAEDASTSAGTDASHYIQAIALSTVDFFSTVASGRLTGSFREDSTAALDDWAIAVATTGIGLNISTQSGAQAALSSLDDAIITKDQRRAEAGSKVNRLQNTVTALTIQAENLQASESAISDADIAAEMTEFTRNRILAQSGVAMLAQANSLSNLALSLLG